MWLEPFRQCRLHRRRRNGSRKLETLKAWRDKDDAVQWMESSFLLFKLLTGIDWYFENRLANPINSSWHGYGYGTEGVSTTFQFTAFGGIQKRESWHSLAWNHWVSQWHRSWIWEDRLHDRPWDHNKWSSPADGGARKDKREFIDGRA